MPNEIKIEKPIQLSIRSRFPEGKCRVNLSHFVWWRPTGIVGNLSLPPLVQGVIDGFAILGKNFAAKTKQRVLVDLYYQLITRPYRLIIVD